MAFMQGCKVARMQDFERKDLVLPPYSGVGFAEKVIKRKKLQVLGKSFGGTDFFL